MTKCPACAEPLTTPAGAHVGKLLEGEEKMTPPTLRRRSNHGRQRHEKSVTTVILACRQTRKARRSAS